jgi:lipoprotein-anchoring transpeptidase ErfK/SrfK
MERESAQAIDGQRAIWLLLLSLAIIALPFSEAADAQRSSRDVGNRRSRQILVSVPDRMLAVIERGTVIRTFPVSVGASASPSPTGEFQIVRRLANPTYYHPGVVIPPGTANPLGPRWIGLSQKGFGVHGTNHPESIGHAASHGCIRLRNRDIKQLFEMISVGDVVEIRGERDQQTAEIFGGADNSTTTLAEARPLSVNPIGQGQ